MIRRESISSPAATRLIGALNAELSRLYPEEGTAEHFRLTADEVAAVCDRVVVIVRGRVVAEERPGETADLEARFLRYVGEAELSE